MKGSKVTSTYLAVCSLLALVSSLSCARALATRATGIAPTPASLFLPFVAKSYSPSTTPTNTPTAALTPTSTETATPTKTGTPTHTPTNTPTSTPTVIPIPVGPFGVQTFGELSNEVPRTRAQEAGILWTRIDVSWASIEPDPPVNGVHTYHWGSLDATVSTMVNAGFTPLLALGHSPQWAVENMPINPDTGQHYNCGPIDEEDLPAFATFVQALVERYDGDGIDDAPGSPLAPIWEFWNEPDGMGPKGLEFSGCWGGYSDSDRDWDNDGMPDPHEYARMLTYAYPAFKAASPDVQLSFGAIAYERSSSVTWFNLDFADEVLGYLQNNHASDPNYPFFDAMSFHAYSNPVLAYNWDPPNLIGKAIGQGVYNTFKNANYMAGRPSVRGLLTNHGLDKPLICSEIGRASGVYWGSPQLNVDPPENNEGQSRYVVRGFVHAMSLWPDVMKTAIWFTLVDPASPKPMGLLEAGSYERKSSWYAYRTLTEELDGAEYDHSLSEAGIEGYVFTMPGGREKTVLWVPPDEHAQPGSPTVRDFAVGAGEQLRVVRMYDAGGDQWRWEEILIPDGDDVNDLDGVVNGQVRIQIDSNPQFVERVPLP